MKRQKEIKKADFLLIGVLVLAGFLFSGQLLFTQKEAAVLQVRVSSKIIQTFSMNENQTFEIEGADGGGNTLVIENGKAWISHADCPDGLCTNMPEISQAGQSIICLPHEVVVELVGSDESKTENDVDFIAG